MRPIWARPTDKTPNLRSFIHIMPHIDTMPSKPNTVRTPKAAVAVQVQSEEVAPPVRVSPCLILPRPASSTRLGPHQSRRAACLTVRSDLRSDVGAHLDGTPVVDRACRTTVLSQTTFECVPRHQCYTSPSGLVPGKRQVLAERDAHAHSCHLQCHDNRPTRPCLSPQPQGHLQRADPNLRQMLSRVLVPLLPLLGHSLPLLVRHQLPSATLPS